MSQPPLNSQATPTFAVEKLIDPRDLLDIIYDKYTTRPIMQKHSITEWLLVTSRKMFSFNLIYKLARES